MKAAADTLTALIHALAADPGDEAGRLILADYLEERGDPRAGVVRDPEVTAERLADEMWFWRHGRYPTPFHRGWDSYKIHLRGAGPLAKGQLTFPFAFESLAVRRAKARTSLAALGYILDRKGRLRG